MHSNNFILSVRDSRKQILREYDGKVYLPFQSEYSLYLKNDNNVRCKCYITIDGTDVLGGSRLVINPNSNINLERFVENSNLGSGKKFKFVSVTDTRVQDPTNESNGIIRAIFHKESIPFSIKLASSCANIGMLATARNASCLSSTYTHCNAGATVQGSQSDQQFVMSEHFNCEVIGTVITLKLIGSDESKTVGDTKKIYCTSCGVKVKFNDNFCSNCGVRI